MVNAWRITLLTLKHLQVLSQLLARFVGRRELKASLVQELFVFGAAFLVLWMELLGYDYYVTARVVLRKVLSGRLLALLGGNLGLFLDFQLCVGFRDCGTCLERVVLDYLDLRLIVATISDAGLGWLWLVPMLLFEWNLPEHALFKQ